MRNKKIINQYYHEVIKINIKNIYVGKRLHVINAVIFLLTSFLFYGNYINNVLGNETYGKYIASPGMGNNMGWLLYNDPRPILAVYYKIFYELNLNPTHFISITEGIAIFLQALTCFVAYYYILNKIKQNNIVKIYSYLLTMLSTIIVWFNPLFTDNLQYPEIIVMIFLGNLSAVCAAVVISKSCKWWWKDCILSCILLIIPMYTYQSAVYFYVLYAMIFYLADYMRYKRKNLIYNIYTNLLKRIGVYVVVAIFEFLYFSIFVTDNAPRGNLHNVNILNNVLHLQVNVHNRIVNTFGLYPKYFMISIIMFVCIVIAYNIFMCKQSKKIEITIVSIMAFIGPFIALFIFGILESWLQPTSISGLPSLVSLSIFILLIMCTYLDGKQLDIKYNKVLIIFIQLLVFSFVMIGYRITNIISVNTFITNTIEQENTKFYLDTIKVYEKNTGKKILNIALAKDEIFTEKFGDYRYSPDRINERVYERLLEAKSETSIFQYLGESNLKRVEMPDEIYIKYFSGKNWNELSQEQIICIGDTAYICLY